MTTKHLELLMLHAILAYGLTLMIGAAVVAVIDAPTWIAVLFGVAHGVAIVAAIRPYARWYAARHRLYQEEVRP